MASAEGQDITGFNRTWAQRVTTPDLLVSQLS